MTNKDQVQHAFDYNYPITIFVKNYMYCSYHGYVSEISHEEFRLEHNAGAITVGWDYVRSIVVQGSSGKLALFYVNGEYLDKDAQRYDKMSNHNHMDNRYACSLCNNRHPIEIYQRQMSPLDYCVQCVTVMNWKDIMEILNETTIKKEPCQSTRIS